MFYSYENGVLQGANSVAFPDGTFLIPDAKAIYKYPVNGWVWFDDEETARAALENTIKGIPQTLLAFQARAALMEIGKFEIVQSYIDSQPANSWIRLAWETFAPFERKSPAVNAIGAELGLDLDALFLAGAAIKI